MGVVGVVGVEGIEGVEGVDGFEGTASSSELCEGEGVCCPPSTLPPTDGLFKKAPISILARGGGGGTSCCVIEHSAVTLSRELLSCELLD